MNSSTRLASTLALGLAGTLASQAQAQTSPASGVQLYGLIDAAVGSVTPCGAAASNVLPTPSWP